MKITKKTAAKAFTEWERRFREDPEGFQSEATKVMTQTAAAYGDAAAPYFLEILKSVS